MLEIADASEHGKNSLNDHADIPLVSFTGTQVCGKPIDLLKAGIREDNRIVPEFVDDVLEGRAIIKHWRYHNPSQRFVRDD